MKIIEYFTEAKNPKAKNEDGLVITKDFIAVIDGSTSKSSQRLSHCSSNGRYCMRIVSNYIRHAPANMTIEAFCRGVTTAVAKHYPKRKQELYTTHPEERMAASVAIYSRLQRQIWLIGDCQCLIGKTAKQHNATGFTFIDNPKPYEAKLSNMRAEKIKALLSTGEATEEELLRHDIARECIIPVMLEEMKNQNKSFSLIDGFPIAVNKVKVVALDFEPWAVVLATDGYPKLFPTLAESEAALEKQRKDDPLNIGFFRATKAFGVGLNSFDDRTYIRFEV